MLERNGLRHGGFELREELEVWKDGKILGLRWNSDSEILAIWVRRPVEDVGKLMFSRWHDKADHTVQLWTMKNYHYYLKQELRPQSPSKRLSDVTWHPEQPMTLYLTEDGTYATPLARSQADHPDCIQNRSFVWDTYTARLPMPNDTASVAVVDGSKSTPLVYRGLANLMS